MTRKTRANQSNENDWSTPVSNTELNYIAMRPYYRSSSFITALAYGLLLSGAVVFLGNYLYLSARDYFIETTVSNINALFAGITVIKQMSPNLDNKEILERLVILDDSVNYSLYDDNRNILASNFIMPDDVDVEVLVEGTLILDTQAGNSLTPRTRKVAARVFTIDDGLYLLMGRDISQSFGKQSIVELLIWGSITAMVVLIILSFSISNMVVRRINQISETAKNIMLTGDLSQRINVGSNKWDDLSRMGQTLNHMLYRIEQLVNGVRQVSNNIAHDLRTPLGHLRNYIEELQYKEPKGIPKRHERYDAMSQIADNLLSAFSSLLKIANIESTQLRKQFENSDLGKIVEDVAELYIPLAEDRHQKLTVKNRKAKLSCNPHLLFQMIANLVDNAIKYSPDGATIEITHTVKNRASFLTVKDQGPGIAKNLHGKVFERFFRVDPSRQTGGNGLGLSLVGAIVKLHNGEVSLANKSPGLLIQIRLPHEKKEPLPPRVNHFTTNKY